MKLRQECAAPFIEVNLSIVPILLASIVHLVKIIVFLVVNFFSVYF